MTWDMKRNNVKRANEKAQDQDFGEKTDKRGK